MIEFPSSSSSTKFVIMVYHLTSTSRDVYGCFWNSGMLRKNFGSLLTRANKFYLENLHQIWQIPASISLVNLLAHQLQKVLTNTYCCKFTSKLPLDPNQKNNSFILAKVCDCKIVLNRAAKITWKLFLQISSYSHLLCGKLKFYNCTQILSTTLYSNYWWIFYKTK